MRNSLLVLSFLLVFCGLDAAHAQPPMMTARQVTMVDDSKPSLDSAKKDKLAMAASNRPFVGSVFLPPAVFVKVISRQTYVSKETEGPTAQSVKRTYTVGLVEVLEGEHKGKKGWLVFDIQEPDGTKQTYVTAGQMAPPRPGGGNP